MTGSETADVTRSVSETAASAYHVSGTLDWGSYAVQIKNQTIIVPAVSFTQPGEEVGQAQPSEESFTAV
jgi:hypothetical protein